jgi:hypothetical protein
MDIKSLLIVGGMAFLILSNNSCSLAGASGGLQSGVQVVTAGVADAREALNVDADANMNPACINAAQEQLGAAWASMSKFDRAIMGLKVATTCADGGGE